MKPYMSEVELINELVEKKHILNSTIPENIFRERAYTTLVNPYKKYICTNYSPITGEYIYKENGSFDDYLKIAEIDDYISAKLSLYINHFEKNFKAYLSELLAEKMKTTNIYCNNYTEFQTIMAKFPLNSNLKISSLAPLTPCHYNFYDFLHIDEMYDIDGITIIQADKNLISNRKRALKSILNISNINVQSNHILIQHYKNNSYIPPIWTVIHTLSLGELFAIYNLLKKNDKIPFVNRILQRRTRSIDIAAFSSKIDKLRKIRNNINHYEPLLPYFQQEFDSGRINEIYAIIEFLKNLFKSENINNIRISWKITPSEIEKNDYNTKYINLVNQILKLL